MLGDSGGDGAKVRAICGWKEKGRQWRNEIDLTKIWWQFSTTNWAEAAPVTKQYNCRLLLSFLSSHLVYFYFQFFFSKNS